MQKGKLSGKVGEDYLNGLSVILVGLGLWLIVDGVLSIVKYPKQTFPEQLIRIIRATVGVIIVLIGIVEI
ncbi:MAG: hypothetical protein ABSB71_05405 [Candidatus Bathyarchaeia archaeon]